MTSVASGEVDAAADLTSVARGGIASLAGAVCSAVANFALVLVVARAISPERAGLFFSVTSLFLLLEVLGRFGADTGLVYFIARWRALALQDRIRNGIRAALAPPILLGLIAACGLFVWAPEVARELGDPHGSAVGLLRLLAAMLPVAIAYDVCIGATRGFGVMRPTVVVEKIARPMAQLALVFLALRTGWVGGIGVGWALPYAGALVAAVWLLRKLIRRRLAGVQASGPRWNKAVVTEFWKFALPRAAASIGQLAVQRLDIVLVASIRGAREAAIYTAATRFLVVGQFVNQAINSPVQPRLSAALSTGAVAHARQLYRVATTWLVLVSWPLFGLTAALAPVYVQLFGHDYRSGAGVVVLLSVAMFVATSVGPVDSVIIMAGRTTWNLATALLAVVVNVGVDLLLIPPYGIFGAAIGWFASIVAANVVPMIVAWVGLGLHPYGRSTTLAFALCSACFVIVPLVAYAVSGGSEIGAALGVLVGSVGYVVGLMHWRDEFELAVLRRSRSRRSAGTHRGPADGVSGER